MALVSAREVAVTVQRTLLDRRGVVMAASPWGKAKTGAQMAAVFAHLLPTVPARPARRLLDVAVGLTFVSWADYAWRGRAGGDAR